MLALAAVAALVLALTSSGSSGRRTHAQARAAAAASARAGATRSRAGAAAAQPSPRVRSLIALGKPIYCAARRGDEVALTFDDGPGPYTRLVLAKLRKHHVRATFFIVGRNIDLVRGPEGASITRQERAAGAVGDHTFTHPLLTSLAPAQARAQIGDTRAALAAASGGPVFLFRPPYGGRDAAIDQTARTDGLLEVMWTVDSADSLGADYRQIERNVIGGLRPGAIILMHENHGQTVRALLAIFAALQRRHLRAVSVPQLLTDDPPSPAQVAAGPGGCGIHASAGGS